MIFPQGYQQHLLDSSVQTAINNNQITVSEQHKEKFLEYIQNNSL